MKPEEIEKVKKLVSDIENFESCYESCVIWGSCPDGDVKSETILSWLIENPHMAEIATMVDKARK